PAPFPLAVFGHEIAAFMAQGIAHHISPAACMAMRTSGGGSDVPIPSPKVRFDSYDSEFRVSQHIAAVAQLRAAFPEPTDGAAPNPIELAAGLPQSRVAAIG